MSFSSLCLRIYLILPAGRPARRRPAFVTFVGLPRGMFAGFIPTRYYSMRIYNILTEPFSHVVEGDLVETLPVVILAVLSEL